MEKVQVRRIQEEEELKVKEEEEEEEAVFCRLYSTYIPASSCVHIHIVRITITKKPLLIPNTLPSLNY